MLAAPDLDAVRQPLCAAEVARGTVRKYRSTAAGVPT
jgi:hypothetical protein